MGVSSSCTEKTGNIQPKINVVRSATHKNENNDSVAAEKVFFML